MSEMTLHKRTTKLTESMKHLEGNSYALKWRQVWAVILGSTLGMTKIKWNLHTGQYAGSVSLTTAKDKRLWSQWRSLGSPGISTSFFAGHSKKGTVDLLYTSVVSIATGWNGNC